jgi:chromosome segregation ATPase
MSVKAIREFSEEAPSDDFQALEEKVYRTIELLKEAREGRQSAEREMARIRQQTGSHNEELESLRREVISLRREREEVRGRVERMLKQIDSLPQD